MLMTWNNMNFCALYPRQRLHCVSSLEAHESAIVNVHMWICII
jgi:hypothetical protein